MTERVLLFFIIGLLGGATVGWSVHARWVMSRLTMHPVLGEQLTPVEWVVNLGKPIIGKFAHREEALDHAARIRNTLLGRADERRARRGERRRTRKSDQGPGV